MGEINLPIDQKIKYLYSTINIRKVIEKKSSWIMIMEWETENYKHNKREVFRHLNLYWNKKWKAVRVRDVI